MQYLSAPSQPLASAQQPSRVRRRTLGLAEVVVLALLVVRVVIGWHSISQPGLQYDETNFVNAATLRIPGFFLPHSLFGIPLMVFAYTGALKSWIYAPILSLFGESPASLREPVTLLVTAGLGLIYLGVRDLAGRAVALLSFVFLAFENSLFWLTRDDVGPSALEFVAKAVLLFAAGRIRADGRQRWIVLALVALWLGVFNKLNFIWVVNAALVASVIVVLANRDLVRTHRPQLVLWGVGLVWLYAAFGLYYFGEHIGSIGVAPGRSEWFQPWAGYATGMRMVLSGTWFYAYAIAPLGHVAAALVDPVAITILVLFTVGSVASVGRRGARNLPIALLALSTVLIALQTLLTRNATAGWHYLAIVPTVFIVVAYGVWSIARLLRRRPAVLGLCIAAGVLALAYNGILMAQYFRALRGEPKNFTWTSEIYRVHALIARQPGRVYTADWGILNPLFALDPSRRYNELAFDFVAGTPAQDRSVGASVLRQPGPKLLVAHATDAQAFAHSDANLFRAFGSHLHLWRVIDGRNGKPIFDIYRLS